MDGSDLSLSAKLYRSLYLCRRAEEYIVKLYPDNEMRTPMHMSMGQEFVSVGVCEALEGKADVFASYRSHAAFLAQTHDTDRFFAELYGRVSGTGGGKGGSMHLCAPDQGHMMSSGVVATQIPVAVGAAFANKQLKNGRTSVVFFGDGAVDTGVFWESVNIASLYKLPMLFVCEENGYAVDTPRSKRQTHNETIVAPMGHYFCKHRAVETVYDLTKSVAEYTRKHSLPALLTVECERFLEHVGIGTDWHWGYRKQEDLGPDAVAIQRQRISSAEAEMIESEVETQIQLSIEKAKASPAPSSGHLYTGVFHE